MNIKLARDRVFPRTTIAWALALLLLPPIACSGTASPAAGGEAEEAAAQGDLIARLPADATTVGLIDFAALRSSPAYEFFKQEGSALGDSDELEEIIAETGIDPRTDLHRIAFVSNRWFSEDMGDGSGAVLVATFDRGKVLESLTGHDTVEHNGYTLYAVGDWDSGDTDDDSHGDESDSNSESHEDGSDDDDEHDGDSDADSESDEEGAASYLTILDDSTVAFGGNETIRAIIDVANGAASARTNNRLMGLLEDVDPDSETWFVSSQDALFKDLTPDDNVPMQQIPIDRINAMIISLRLTDGLQVNLRGRTEESADAKLLGDSLNGMLAFGKMMIQGSDPEVFSILDRGINAGSSGRDVTLRAELSFADLEALRDYAHKMFADSMGGEPAG